MPTTPGLPDLGPLPNVPREIEALASHFAALTVLNEATAPEGSLSAPIKSIVLSEMLRHPVAHFACHGHSDSEDPSRSLLLLRDHANDPLTAGSLGPVALEEAQLAYLSACSTASTLSTGLLDESIHLASAFQIAGFPHVISTLWEIGDKISVQVANDFYAGLCLEGGVFDSRRAPYALHQAIRAARIVEDDSGVCTVRHPFLWASYIHVGA
jgi:CHAT domain-containing protein